MEKTQAHVLANCKLTLNQLIGYFNKAKAVATTTKKFTEQNERLAEIFAPNAEYIKTLDSVINRMFDNVGALQIRKFDEQQLEQLRPSIEVAQNLALQGTTPFRRFTRYATLLTDESINLEVDALQLSEFADKISEDYKDTALFVNNFVLDYQDTEYDGLFGDFDDRAKEAEENAAACKNLADNPIPNHVEYAMQIVDRDDKTCSLRDSLVYYKYTLECPYYDEISKNI